MSSAIKAAPIYPPVLRLDLFLLFYPPPWPMHQAGVEVEFLIHLDDVSSEWNLILSFIRAHPYDIAPLSLEWCLARLRIAQSEANPCQISLPQLKE